MVARPRRNHKSAFAVRGEAYAQGRWSPLDDSGRPLVWRTIRTRWVAKNGHHLELGAVCATHADLNTVIETFWNATVGEGGESRWVPQDAELAEGGRYASPTRRAVVRERNVALGWLITAAGRERDHRKDG